MKQRKKISESEKGEKHYRWIKDRSRLKKSENKRTTTYAYWVKGCKIRDNFICKMSNKDCKGRLEVHHILRYSEHPSLRYNLNNGVTLCHFHHPRKKVDEDRLSPYFKKLITNKMV